MWLVTTQANNGSYSLSWLVYFAKLGPAPADCRFLPGITMSGQRLPPNLLCERIVESKQYHNLGKPIFHQFNAYRLLEEISCFQPSPDDHTNCMLLLRESRNRVKCALYWSLSFAVFPYLSMPCSLSLYHPVGRHQTNRLMSAPRILPSS